MTGIRDETVVPKDEEELLNYFLDVRVQLSKMKQDRKQFLHSKDVRATYQRVLTKVRELDELRKRKLGIMGANAAKITLIHSPEVRTRVDSVIDDIFQLLCLSFLTVGLKNGAAAKYSSLSTVQSLLEHLDESGVFTHHDLGPIKERLDEIVGIVNKNNTPDTTESTIEDNEVLEQLDAEKRANKVEEYLLIQAKLQSCLTKYQEVKDKLEAIPEALQPFIEQLFQIRRELLSLAALKIDIDDSNKSKDPLDAVSEDDITDALEDLKERLAEIERMLNQDCNEDGKIIVVGESENEPEQGNSVLNGLLDDCHDIINDLSHKTNKGLVLDPMIKPIYEEVSKIKATLENLLVTRRWALRETDLFTYQKRLSELDSLRVNSKFPSQSKDYKGQAVLLYLLRRCYALIYKLLESSEPVSESLQHIHNQSSAVRRCLLELKRMGGVDHERELYPYQMKLASLDNMRVDGKFYDADGNIPEGQGTLNVLLAECFDILHEMKIELELREEEAQAESQCGANKPAIDKNIQMTKDTSNCDIPASRQAARYLDVYDYSLSSHYNFNDETNYSYSSYEDDDTANYE
ncbi:HDL018Wp [Eremothecium sinecaudum]|uniref:HDL018Wp n=1 Tax=Eremothecium sinecaudum TaxID=45286 RepID=A0A0X8HRV8_9SACH|nr:HDL018Wp [Eremothecium sinecaudum]AMD20726.1 HDL018Wp [Eremothecium sinecaudum]